MKRNSLKSFPLLLLILTSFSCSSDHKASFTPAERRKADSLVKSVRGETALDSLSRTMAKEEDVLGQITVLREWGKLLRNESRFDEALEKHGLGLELAEQAGDTLEWVQALNNMGTDYRRMGILDAAQQYHKSALMIAEECADTTFRARKNRVVSLNGLANVYLTIQNYHLADSCLRQALAGETALGSLTGQAINLANLGSIFETNGQTDSAWVYFRKSMELNARDANTLGIALCHTYYGNLFEKAHQPDKALAEYNEAYRLMKDSKDEWHMLNALTSLAGIYIAQGADQMAEAYLAEAKTIATKIRSTEHLVAIYNLYYKLRKNHGDWQGALLAHEQAAALQDSLIDMEKVNRMQSISYNIERGQHARRVTAVNDKLAQERFQRQIAYAVFAVIILLLGVVIGLLFYNSRLRKRSYDALKKLNAVRESFFRNITHEFRTPLTVIIGLSHDLQQDKVTTAEVQDMGAAIERQGNSMLRLINQLLDISKIRSAIGQPEWKSGNIVAYVNMIVETFDEYARKSDIKLQFVAPENEIDTDFVPDYINKLMGNLLSNALKFTLAYGTVTVMIGRKAGKLSVEVSDTGSGIPKECLPHIFQEFYQADSGNGGTGVGLALVNQIVKQLEGKISVESEVGKGTKFHILIPLHPVAHDRIAEEQVNARMQKEMIGESLSTADAPTSQANVPLTPNGEPEGLILIVEDNSDIASFIGKRLGGKYRIRYARNGADGLTMAREQLPDAIVTDLMMPKMDGLELTRQLRADFLTCHIPVVILTAKVTEKDRIEGLEAGADAYLTKPFSSEELLTRVDKLLEQRALLRKKFAQEVIVGQASDDTSSSGSQHPLGRYALHQPRHRLHLCDYQLRQARRCECRGGTFAYELQPVLPQAAGADRTDAGAIHPTREGGEGQADAYRAPRNEHEYRSREMWIH